MTRPSITGGSPRAVAWIGLGSNLDHPFDQVARAGRAIAALPDIELLAMSSLYQCPPVGGPPGQPDFCNAAAAIVFAGPARTLLERLHAIEHAQGRVRDVRWGARTLDLDLIAVDRGHGLQRSDHARLRLPHPLAAERAFVLKPLAEIAPALMLDGERVIEHHRRIDSDHVIARRP